MFEAVVAYSLTCIVLLQAVPSLAQSDGSPEGSEPASDGMGVEEGLLIMCTILTILLIMSGLYVLISSARARAKKHQSLDGGSGMRSPSSSSSPSSSGKRKNQEQSEVLYNLPSVGTTENSVTDSAASSSPSSSKY